MKYKMKVYENFNIWQKGLELKNMVFWTSDILGKDISKDVYTTAIQLEKSILAIVSNLAEGFIRRDKKKDNEQSFHVVLILLELLEEQIVFSEQSGFITPAQSKEILICKNELYNMITELLEIK